MTDTVTTTVDEIPIENKIGEFGSLITRRRFRVRRPGKEAHVVTFEFSHSGAPQETTCDCRGYKFHQTCSHINAVYNDDSVVFPCFDND